MPGIVSSIFGKVMGPGGPFGGGGGGFGGLFGGGGNPFASAPRSPMPAQPTANLPQTPQQPPGLPPTPMPGQNMGGNAYQTRHMREGSDRRIKGGGGPDYWNNGAFDERTKYLMMGGTPEGWMGDNPAQNPVMGGGGGAQAPQGPLAGNQTLGNTPWPQVKRYNFGGRRK